MEKDQNSYQPTPITDEQINAQQDKFDLEKAGKLAEQEQINEARGSLVDRLKNGDSKLIEDVSNYLHSIDKADGRYYAAAKDGKISGIEGINAERSAISPSEKAFNAFIEEDVVKNLNVKVEQAGSNWAIDGSEGSIPQPTPNSVFSVDEAVNKLRETIEKNQSEVQNGTSEQNPNTMSAAAEVKTR